MERLARTSGPPSGPRIANPSTISSGADRAREVIAGESGIAILDHFTRELIETRLSPQPCADVVGLVVDPRRGPPLGARVPIFFLQHLRDGDAASNTLSWRWVAELHTGAKPTSCAGRISSGMSRPSCSRARRRAGETRVREIRPLPWQDPPPPPSRRRRSRSRPAHRNLDPRRGALRRAISPVRAVSRRPPRHRAHRTLGARGLFA